MTEKPQTWMPEVRYGTDGMTIVLPEAPSERWHINVLFIDGEPRFTRIDYATSDPDSRGRLAQDFRPPIDRLIGTWCLYKGLNLDGTPHDGGRNLWAALSTPQQIDLSRKPDPRPYGDGDGRIGEESDDYKAVMDRWTRPIAEAMTGARIAGKPIREAVMIQFGVKVAVAKKYISLAYRWNRRFNPGTGLYEPVLGARAEDGENYGTDPDTWVDRPRDPRTPEWGGQQIPESTDPTIGSANQRKDK